MGKRRSTFQTFWAESNKDGREVGTLILETKGYDPLADVKQAGARRWLAAVNADGAYGRWAYRLIKSPADAPGATRSAVEELSRP